MPSLSERREDIPILTQHFTQKYRGVRAVLGITPEAQRLLMAYRWPGNVRELENAVEHGLVLGESDYIRPEDLPEALTEAKAPETMKPDTYYAVVNDTKRSVITRALEKAEGNIPEAARLLDVSQSYLRRLIRNLDVKVP